MAKRIQLSTGASEPYQHLLGLHRMVEKAAADAGLGNHGDQRVQPARRHQPQAPARRTLTGTMHAIEPQIRSQHALYVHGWDIYAVSGRAGHVSLVTTACQERSSTRGQSPETRRPPKISLG